jgi:hypothetical protein
VLNFEIKKKMFFNDRKWLEMIRLYEKLCIMIGVMKISVKFLRLKKNIFEKL